MCKTNIELVTFLEKMETFYRESITKVRELYRLSVLNDFILKKDNE